MRQNLCPSRPSPAAAVVPCLLVLVPLAFGRWTLEPFTYNKAVLLQIAALAIVAWFGPGRLWNALRGAGRDPAAIGALLFGASAVLSTVISVSPRTSLQGAPESYTGLGVVLAYLVLFFSARTAFASTAGIRTVAAAAAIAAAGAAAYAALQAAGREPLGWEDMSQVGGFVRPFGTLGHPNFLGAYLAMAIPLLLYLAAESKRLGQRGAFIVWLLVTGLAAAGVVASLSRAAWLAAVCGVAVTCCARPWPRIRWRPVLGLSVIVVGVSIVAVSWSESGFAAGITARLRALGAGGGRYQIWQTAWLVFTDHPWFGSGLDTFQLVFGSRQTADYWHIEWGVTSAKAHNEFLHALATQGLVGGLALLAWCAGVVVAVVQSWRRVAGEDRPAFTAALAALVVFVVQVQFGFAEPSCGVLAVTLAGLLAGFGKQSEGKHSGQPLTWPVNAGAGLAMVMFAINAFAGTEPFGLNHALAVVVVGSAVLLTTYVANRVKTVPVPLLRAGRGESVAIPEWLFRAAWGVLAAGVGLMGLVRPYLADCACQAAEMARDVDPAAAKRQCQNAVDLAPEYAFYWTKLTAAAKSAADRESSLIGRHRQLRIALEAANRAVSLVPADAMNHANRGKILASLAQIGEKRADAALADFDEAIARMPYNLIVRGDAGQAALDCGQPARARQYFEAGRAVDPGFARFASGLGAVALTERHPEQAVSWLEQALNLAWYDDVAGHERLPALLATAYLGARHTKDAERWAREAVALHPDEAGAHRVLAAALQMEGRSVEAANEYRKVIRRESDAVLIHPAEYSSGGASHTESIR